MAYKNKPHYEHLKNKWTDLHNNLQKNLWDKHGEALEWLTTHTKQLAVGSISSLMLLTTPITAIALPASQLLPQNEQILRDIDPKELLSEKLLEVLPQQVQPLTSDEEKKVTQLLSQQFGMQITAELEGKRLNRNYGLIGQEQHLARYPGDTMVTHFDTAEEAARYGAHGMAPGLGAWSYFAPSFEQFTDKDKEREKYYIAVQTFLSEGFNERFAEYRDFYKYRKMLLVNPENGKAIVTDIADAGPAEWTGKHLGGSPEVMKYLERVDGRQRGPVLYFFIDDPSDTIPLGPLEVQ